MNFKDLFRTKSITQIIEDINKTPEAGEEAKLQRHLGVRDLTAFGIAAIIGAGIFTSVGKVCFDGGPGVIFLYIFIAIACGFSAMCYASFASMIPISGSAYTYAYATFGELVAWIIGWDLIIEYAIGNIAVAKGWSSYFTSMLDGFGIHFPDWLCMNYSDASHAFHAAQPDVTSSAYLAYTEAPKIFGMPFVIDFSAFLIVSLISILIYIGIKESRNVSNMLVLLKISVVILVIIAGAFYVDPANWHPFMPNGIPGILKGVSGVFFAYIGFDAISTTAEECKNPQRDLPRGMMYSLLICTVLYILIALVVTGMVKYSDLANADDPLAFIFGKVGVNWISYIVSVSAIVAMASVLLVFQLGQPRILMSMSRDKLLPKRFGKLHPKFKTPSFATVLTGIFVAVPALFLDMNIVLDMTSVGTLFAFILVCGGVLILDVQKPEQERKFKIPFADSKYFLIPTIVVVIFLLLMKSPSTLQSLVPDSFATFESNMPIYLFLGVTFYLAIASLKYKLSLIPVLGLLTCLYLMAQISTASWYRFFIWMALGLIVYFAYSHKNSKLNVANA